MKNERYIYSERCANDIKKYLYELCDSDFAIINRLETVLGLEKSILQDDLLPIQLVDIRLRAIQKIINKNKESLGFYYRAIIAIIEPFRKLIYSLQNRKNTIEREITKKVSSEEDRIALYHKEIDKLDSVKNADAINNRKKLIESAYANIERYLSLLTSVTADKEYFEKLLALGTKVKEVVKTYEALKNVYGENKYSDIYSAINHIGQLIGGYYSLSWDFSKLDEKYNEGIASIKDELDSIRPYIINLQNITEKYLDYNDFRYVSEEGIKVSELRTNAIKLVYDRIIEQLDVKLNGKNTALKFSPYLYLQTIYQYQGSPNAATESLLAIDEAQGIAPEEIRLLKNLNKNDVVFNMYGDIYQHIEGTKGVDSWDEYKDVVEFQTYEMQENYRNASQITEYCNHAFHMNMNPINTPGNGVQEISSEEEFYEEVIRQITDDKGTGLSAILVKNQYEADYILDVFSGYEKKFHNMTGDDFNIHQTRWNIINIDDAKGLEFRSVIVLAGKMSRNEKYIAYTRALDELLIYHGDINIAPYQEKKVNRESKKEDSVLTQKIRVPKQPESGNTHKNSKVREFFEQKDLEVVDQRDDGGRLWVVGNKNDIREVVNEAISRFGISGKYLSGKEIKNRNGWCTKTDK